MKKINFGMLAAILTCGLLTTSCFQDDNPVEPLANDEVDVFWDFFPVSGDSAVIAALESIENVVDVKPFRSTSIGQAYYFNYIQPIDHENPDLGSFKQQVVITFVDEDAPTILHTQGYSLVGEPHANHNRLDSIGAPYLLWALSNDFGEKGFDLNSVQVEYRYHGFSLPEGDRNSFKYLNAWQQSQDIHAIVSDLKEALITGDGKWLSTGTSKGGMTTAQYAYYDDQYGWNDIDVYVPFVAPIPIHEYDIRVGEYMLTSSSKPVLPALKKIYQKLVDDEAIASATAAKYAENWYIKTGDELSNDSLFLITITGVMNNLFKVQSYGDYDTWTKLIPNENSSTDDYVTFFMLNDDDQRIYRKTNNARGPLKWRQDPFQVQIGIDQGNMDLDYTWYLEGQLLTDSDKAYLKRCMDNARNSKIMDLEVELLKNLETTNKKMIFVYGENDPWTGAGIPDPKNPNVKKYVVPFGTHTDNLQQFGWYPEGKVVADKIFNDIKELMK